jgi:hypothetical protein
MSFVASKIPLFGPRQVPGLALWLDASDTTTVVLSNNNVTQWNDKSGGRYNATSIGSQFPTYSSNSIVFTGTQAFATTLQSLIPNQSGFAVVNYSGGPLATFTTDGITVGNRFSLNETWPGHLCEIIIYNRSITTTERQKVEGYLAYKWGLRSKFPGNHPYKNIPVS